MTLNSITSSNARYAVVMPIDGSTTTHTWTTESGNTAAASIGRLRIHKDNDTGRPGTSPRTW